jgi:parallel beta-helix repeat protein
MIRPLLLVFLALASLAAFPGSARAAESYDSCTGFITSLPKTITQPGVWCMTADLATADPNARAILVSAHNVVVDCNDHKLDGMGAGAATAALGISATNRLNVTVRHCNVLGFQQGIRLAGTGGGHVVEDNRVDSSTYAGIVVNGDGSVVRRNQVINIGGSTAMPTPFGLVATGVVDLVDNTVTGVTATGPSTSAYGIYATSGNGASISGNRVRDVLRTGTKPAYGIFIDGAPRMVLRGNEVLGDSGAGNTGLRCGSTGDRARNNTVTGFATALQGCGDGGGNDLGN